MSATLHDYRDNKQEDYLLKWEMFTPNQEYGFNSRRRISQTNTEIKFSPIEWMTPSCGYIITINQVKHINIEQIIDNYLHDFWEIDCSLSLIEGKSEADLIELKRYKNIVTEYYDEIGESEIIPYDRKHSLLQRLQDTKKSIQRRINKMTLHLQSGSE